jgi:hypothetical protein
VITLRERAVEKEEAALGMEGSGRPRDLVEAVVGIILLDPSEKTATRGQTDAHGPSGPTEASSETGRTAHGSNGPAFTCTANLPREGTTDLEPGSWSSSSSSSVSVQPNEP